MGEEASRMKLRVTKDKNPENGHEGSHHKSVSDCLLDHAYPHSINQNGLYLSYRVVI